MDELVVAIDTRERRPYEFSASQVRTLATGDYSILGWEDRIAVERKTLSDAYSSLGRDRKRFRSEFERLAKLDYAAVVIEASLRGFLGRPAFSRMSPRAAIATLLSWSVRYGVGVFFAEDRRHGNAVTRVLLEKYWRQHGGAKAGGRVEESDR